MAFLRRDGKRSLQAAVKPSLAKAVEEYAADKRLTKQHIIIAALCDYLKRSGYWPPETKEEQEARRIEHLQRMRAAKTARKKGASRKAKGSTTPPGADKPAARRPSRIAGGKAGRPIGGPRRGRPIGAPRKSSSGFTP